MRGLLCGAVAALSLAMPVGAAAQDLSCQRGDLEVRSLEFIGNKTFRDDELARRIVTTPSSITRRLFRFFGRRYCLDSTEVRRDVLRLTILYREVGFPEVRIGTDIRRVNPNTVGVRFRIEEGRPMLVQQVDVSGLDSVPNGARMGRDVLPKTGERFDRRRMDASRDSLARRLHNQGYPLAEVLRGFETDTAAHVAAINYQVISGPRSRIGAINVRIDSDTAGRKPKVRADRVRQVLGIGDGDLFRERALEQAKRGLYLTDAFRHVEISVDSASLVDDADSLVTVDVALREDRLHSSRVSVGWGTLDCFRAQGEYSNFNFLGRLLRLDLTGRLSKIGTGSPFDVARSLCAPQVKQDPLSDTLNYYAGATFSQAALYRLQYVPSLTVYSERRSEYLAFRRDTPIGLLASALREGSGRWPMSFTYQLEFGRTLAQPTFFCGVFRVCELEAQKRLTQQNRLATLGWRTTRNRANDFSNPDRGSIMQLEARHASPVVGSDPRQQFNRALVDYANYRRVLGGSVLVLRLRAGTVIGTRIGITDSTETNFIPLQERMYAGGPNSLRGYQQNELGEALYVPTKFDTVSINDTTGYWRAFPAKPGQDQQVVPSGGDNVVVGNAELRVRSPVLPDLVQYAFFVDAGEVWNRRRDGIGGFGTLKVTPGVGVRVFTPIGPVRVDVGYNPYARPAGRAYFTPQPTKYTSGAVLELICVSPTTSLLVHTTKSIGVDGKPFPPRQDPGACDASYMPSRRTSFLGRLTFQFSIGQAF